MKTLTTDAENRMPLLAAGVLTILMTASAGSALAIEADGSLWGTPDNNALGWGGWSRGDEYTIYAEWDEFGAPGTPGPLNDLAPDVGSFGPGIFELTETTGVAGVTQTLNIYTFVLPIAFDIDIGGYGTGLGPTQVAVQMQILGANAQFGQPDPNPPSDQNPPARGEYNLASLNLAENTVLLNGTAPNRINEFHRGPSGVGFGGSAVDTLFVWDLPDSADSYELTFDATASSMSLTNLTFDAYTDVSAVPLPAAFWLFAGGLAVVARVGARRRTAPVGLAD